MRRLPTGIILRTQVVYKIVLDEHPASADLGSRDFAVAGLFGEGHPMDLQELSGFVERKGLHCRYAREFVAVNPALSFQCFDGSCLS